MYRDDISSQGTLDSRAMRNDGDCAKQAVGIGPNPNYRGPSMADLHAKTAAHHAEQADKSARAQAFFATHPEFDEFIQLIRQGAIQI